MQQTTYFNESLSLDILRWIDGFWYPFIQRLSGELVTNETIEIPFRIKQGVGKALT